MLGTLAVTGDDAADHLLNTDPLALLLAMLLDQQVPMEWAFIAPSFLKERMGGRLDAAEIAAMDPDEFFVHAKGPRAIHRFPGSMAKRVQEVCAAPRRALRRQGRRLWDDRGHRRRALRRLKALPGFGDEKSKIFIALLAKRIGVAPAGWRGGGRSVRRRRPPLGRRRRTTASLAKVRAWKKAKKRRQASPSRTEPTSPRRLRGERTSTIRVQTPR